MSPEQLLIWISQYGYAAIVFLLALGIVGIPVPDETLLTITGFLIFNGTLHPVPAYLSALGGTVIGISTSYTIGAVGGRRLVRRIRTRWKGSSARFDRVEAWIRTKGQWTLLVSFFVPGVRHLAALVAGSSGLSFARFARYAYSGALLWSACFVGAGYYLGEGWSSFPRLVRPIALGALIVAILLAAAYGWRSRHSAG